MQNDWQELGRLDPMWAVLSQDEYRFQHGDTSRFLATGEEEAAHILNIAARFGLPERRSRCLDVGCGVGRMTRALAKHFDTCTGVDIAESMLEGARVLNRDLSNCSFVMNDGADLRGLETGSFDLVNASIMLQHISDAVIVRGYIAEFVRVLAPRGIAVFQVPAAIPLRNRMQPRARAFHLLRATGLSAETLYGRAHLHPIRMHALAPARVVQAIEAARGALVLAESDVEAGPVRTPRYYVTRG